MDSILTLHLSIVTGDIWLRVVFLLILFVFLFL
jgi:hypothetical protein